MQRIIALSRTYTDDFTKIPELIKTNRKLVEQLRDKVEHVRFVVWENSLFSDADCRKTYTSLKATFKDDPFVSVRKGGGDIFVGVLNSQFAEIVDEGYGWLLVISATSGHLITEKVAQCVDMAMNEHGVDAVAIVPPDVPSAGKGAITNQCAYWRVSLIKDGFDPIDTRPVVFDYTEHYQGVGELVNLFRSSLRQPLAVIFPDVDRPDDRTVLADPKQVEKLAHKNRRIAVVLEKIGKTATDLSRLIMEGYPIKA